MSCLEDLSIHNDFLWKVSLSYSAPVMILSIASIYLQSVKMVHELCLHGKDLQAKEKKIQVLRSVC